MRKVITPVGLSLFSNFFKQNKSKSLYEDFEHFKGKADRLYTADEYPRYQDDVGALREAVLDFAMHDQHAAAEINSSLEIVKEIQQSYPYETFQICFIVSDTFHSACAADILSSREVFNSHFSDIDGITQHHEVAVVEGLQVSERDTFVRYGMINLIRLIRRLAQESSKSLAVWRNIVLNITGGYKATIPYLTILSQIYTIPLYYIFDTSESDSVSPELIRIPRAPLAVDWAVFERHALLLGKIEHGVPNFETFKQRHAGEIEEIHSCIEEIDDEPPGQTFGFLSPLGTILWEEFNAYYMVKVSPHIFSRFHKKRRIIEDSIRGLFSELVKHIVSPIQGEKKERIQLATTEDIHLYLEGLSDKSNLNHTGTISVKGVEKQKRKAFIYKYSPGGIEVRLCYDVELENSVVKTLTIFDCVAGGNFDHGRYRKQFEDFYGQYLEGNEYHYLHVVPKS